mgnify:FL=1
MSSVNAAQLPKGVVQPDCSPLAVYTQRADEGLKLSGDGRGKAQREGHGGETAVSVSSKLEL